MVPALVGPAATQHGQTPRGLDEAAGNGDALRWSEADRQLEVGRADGLPAVCADLVERSVA